MILYAYLALVLVAAAYDLWSLTIPNPLTFGLAYQVALMVFRPLIARMIESAASAPSSAPASSRSRTG